MDIRFTNRWEGFSTNEIVALLNAIEWYMVEKDLDYDDFIFEMDYEIRKRDELDEDIS